MDDNNIIKSVLVNRYLFQKIVNTLSPFKDYTIDEKKCCLELCRYKDWYRAEDMIKHGHMSLLLYKIAKNHDIGIDIDSIDTICEKVTDTEQFMFFYNRHRELFRGRTLIASACRGGNLEIVKLLVEQKKPCLLSPKGFSGSPHLHILDFFAHQPTFEFEKTLLLNSALDSKTPDKFMWIVNQFGADYITKWVNTHHQLYRLILFGNVELVKKFKHTMEQSQVFLYYLNSSLQDRSKLRYDMMMYFVEAYQQGNPQEEEAIYHQKLEEIRQRHPHVSPDDPRIERIAVEYFAVRMADRANGGPTGMRTALSLEISLACHSTTIIKQLYDTMPHEYRTSLIEAIATSATFDQVMCTPDHIIERDGVGIFPHNLLNIVVRRSDIDAIDIVRHFAKKYRLTRIEHAGTNSIYYVNRPEVVVALIQAGWDYNFFRLLSETSANSYLLSFLFEHSPGIVSSLFYLYLFTKFMMNASRRGDKELMRLLLDHPPNFNITNPALVRYEKVSIDLENRGWRLLSMLQGSSLPRLSVKDITLIAKKGSIQVYDILKSLGVAGDLDVLIGKSIYYNKVELSKYLVNQPEYTEKQEEDIQP